jgi:hypothetical protein
LADLVCTSLWLRATVFALFSRTEVISFWFWMITLSQATGLDHYQVRLYPAWYRHIALAWLAFSCVQLAGTSGRAQAAAQSTSPASEIRGMSTALSSRRTAKTRTAPATGPRWRQKHQEQSREVHYRRQRQRD